MSWRRYLPVLGLATLLAGVVVFTALGVWGLVQNLARVRRVVPAGSTPIASPPRNIVVAVSGAIPTLDPAQAQDTESVGVVQLLYQTLFTYGPQDRLVGCLAQDWSWNATDTVLTVHLNPRARFADGSPVTAQDVVFSLDRMLQTPEGAPEALAFSALEGFADLRAGVPSDGILAEGEHTVVFRLTQPLPTLPALLAMPSTSIVERSLASTPAASSPSWWFQNSAGSGPYVLGQYVPDVSLTLRPNPRYWAKGLLLADGQTEGPYAAVTFLIVSSPQEQLQLFREGRLDVLDPLAPSQEDELGAVPAGTTLLAAPSLEVSYLGFNTAKPPFDQLAVRLAVAYALNKQALLTAAGGQGEVAAGLLPPGVPGADPTLAPYPYQPGAAKALLADAGLATPIPVTLLTIAAGGTVQQGQNAVAEVVAKELDAVGFAVSVRAEPWPAYWRDMEDGYDNLFQATWLADYPSAQDFFFNLLDSASIGANNASFYANAVFDRLDAQAVQTVSTAERRALYRELDDLAYQQLPVLPEYYPAATALIRGNLQPASLAVFLAAPLMPQYDQVHVVQP